MIDLFASIALSSLLYVIFKSFSIYKVNTLHAIVVNYVFACITGIFMSGVKPDVVEIVNKPWIWGAVALGVLFITIFNVMARTSQVHGLSVASVASKMSLVVPVVAGIMLYNEELETWNVIGIVLALISVYLTSMRPSDDGKKSASWWLPILLFFGSGTIDTTLKYVEKTYLSTGEDSIFSATIFACAFVFGIIALIYTVIRGERFTLRSFLGGIILGVPNFFSIFFLVRALRAFDLSSVAFTLNHMGTILLTTIIGLLLFKERLRAINYIGVGVALLAIYLIVFLK